MTDDTEALAEVTPVSPVPARAVTPIIVTLSLGGLIVALMQTVAVPLLPSAPTLLHTSAASASWLVTATLIAGCVAHPVFGRLGDMFGKRRMILIVLGSDVLGSVLCALTSSIWLLTAGRALEGLGLAVIPLGISILRDELPPERVASGVASVSATLGTGGVIGYPASAAIIEYTDWHIAFWLAAAVAAVNFTLVLRYVPESPVRAGGRFDVPGAIGLGLALVLILVAMDKAATWGWLSVRVGTCFTAGLVLLALWTLLQLRTREPLVDLRLSMQAHIRATHLAALAIGVGFYVNSLATSLQVQEPKATGIGLGRSVLVAGLCSVPAGVAMLTLAATSARVARRIGPARTIAGGAALMGLGYAMRVLVPSGLTAILVGTGVVAAGAVFAYSSLPLLIMSAVPLHETAAANGLNTLMRQVGQTIGGAVTTSVIATMTIEVAGTEGGSVAGYRVVFGFAAVASMIGAGLALLARRNAIRRLRARTMAA